MSKAIDYDLKTSAHEVQRLMGQCILRLQVYELLLKSVVTAHEISSPIATLATAQTDRADEIRCNTLGMLIRQMLGSFLEPRGQEGKGRPRNDAPSVTFRMQIILTQDDFNRTEADLRNLVEMRNHLVHHFIEEHDLESPGAVWSSSVLSRRQRKPWQQVDGHPSMPLFGGSRRDTQTKGRMTMAARLGGKSSTSHGFSTCRTARRRDLAKPGFAHEIRR